MLTVLSTMSMSSRTTSLLRPSRARSLALPLLSLLLVLPALALPLSAQNGMPGDDPAGVPGVPGDCVVACDGVLQMLLAPCVLADGTVDQECAEKATIHFDFQACVADCEAQNGGGDPEVLACQGGCYDAYASSFEDCAAPDGTVDPECLAAHDIAFVECFVACGDVPWLPDLATCAPACTSAYEAGLAACRSGGALDPACFDVEREAYNSCLGACGLFLLPVQDLCIRGCEKAFYAALAGCGGMAGANGIVDPAQPGEPGDPGDEECVAAAQRAFDGCLTGCGVTIPDELRCAGECDQALQVRLAGCEMDPACERAALDEYTMCLNGCGIIVPPIPEPDPCVSACDLNYQDAVGRCIDPAAGVVDGECLLGADSEYLSCLESCGVILPEPPNGDPTCTRPCEIAYQQALEGCYSVEPDGMAMGDEACIAAADSAYLLCLEGCGAAPGPLPGDPGLPGGECDQACGAEVLGALFDCAAEGGGMVGTDCLLAVGDAFNACLAACSEQAGERVLGAVGRAGSGLFLRGDADLNGTLQITDPIRTLSYLFLGGVAPACEDAADSDDSGGINISDATVVLNYLFLGGGALPAPSGAPGTDPTPDDLGCSR
jgi:hypothetical protein